MVDPGLVEAIDRALDEGCSQIYKDQPLAQDLARVFKDKEEQGESIAEMILLTGQNPRKGTDPTAYDRLLKELADRALTGIYAIQHFTKDINETARIIKAAQDKHRRRLV
jgi:hypothetical protein